MPKAGFWAVGGYRISFRKDGHWYADDERIENPRIALLFSRHLRPAREGEKGEWVIDVGIDRQSVEVEDTPLVVVAVDGDAVAGFRIRTNDGVVEELDASTLEVGAGDVLYCRVQRQERGELRARFARAAYYRVAEAVVADGDRMLLATRGRSFEIRRAA